jgi:hypothetical protein
MILILILLLIIYSTLLLICYLLTKNKFIIVTSFDTSYLSAYDKYTYYNISNIWKCVENSSHFHYILITPYTLISLAIMSSENFTKKVFYNNRKLFVCKEEY